MTDLPMKIVKALDNLKLIAGLAVLLAAAYFAGHDAGKGSAKREYETAKSEEVQAQAQAVVEYQTKEVEKRIEVKVRDIARERALEADLSTMRHERDFLQKVLRETPDPEDVHPCRISVGDVRVLNYAASTYRSDPHAGTPSAADIAAFEEQTPSTVSCREFVSGETDIRFQYNELARRHDQLVEWVETELVVPQLDPASNNK